MSDERTRLDGLIDEVAHGRTVGGPGGDLRARVLARIGAAAPPGRLRPAWILAPTAAAIAAMLVWTLRSPTGKPPQAVPLQARATVTRTVVGLALDRAPARLAGARPQPRATAEPLPLRPLRPAPPVALEGTVAALRAPSPIEVADIAVQPLGSIDELPINALRTTSIAVAPLDEAPREEPKERP